MASNSYRSSGVDLDLMDGLKERIKAYASLTHGPEVLDSQGSFAGLYRLNGFKEPLLVASTDGVGTKLKIAAQLDHYESVGQDLVSLNVNDILTKGARPLFFLDYVAFSSLDPQLMDSLVRGIVWGCKEAGCALIGGETAQMPDMVHDGGLELAGFVVGAVEREALVDGKTIQPGDCLIGVPSSGLHTNGYSLVRQVFGTDENPNVLFKKYEGMAHNLGEELLVRHRCYYPEFEPVLGQVKGLAHITGGGLPGKMPSILPLNVAVEFDADSWERPPIFRVIQREGELDSNEMYRVFNMGLGMVAVCGEDQVAGFIKNVPDAVVVGRVMERQGDEQVIIRGL